LLFILGEYSTNELITDKYRQSDFFNSILIFTLDLADYILASQSIKENYFYSFLIYITKVLINAKVSSNKLNIKLKEKEINSFEEYSELLKEKLNKLIINDDLFDLETFGILEMLKKIFVLLKFENESFFNEFVNKKQLLPLHEKAQSMVTMDKENDLIKFCFPIDDEELIIDSKIPKKNKNAGFDKDSTKSVSNLDDNKKAEENENEKDENKDKNERIVVDKNFYMPNN